jgi:hypothetical protein
MTVLNKHPSEQWGVTFAAGIPGIVDVVFCPHHLLACTASLTMASLERFFASEPTDIPRRSCRIAGC